MMLSTPLGKLVVPYALGKKLLRIKNLFLYGIVPFIRIHFNKWVRRIKYPVTHDMKILTLLDSEDFPATDTGHSVIIKDLFADGIIEFISDDFKEWFFEKSYLEISTRLFCFNLKEWSADMPIIDDLDNGETYFPAIYELIRRQRHGEPGMLLTNNRHNIFYMRDKDEIPRTISVYYVPFPGNWTIMANDISDADCPFRWREYSRVFSSRLKKR